MEAPVGDEYSKIQCDNIPPNRHDIQVFDEFIIHIYIYIYTYTCILGSALAIPTLI